MISPAAGTAVGTAAGTATGTAALRSSDPAQAPAPPIGGPEPHRAWLIADLAAKTALLALLAFAATHTGWHRFHGKAMVGRAVAYPVLLALLPLTWWLRRPGRRVSYPAPAAFVMTLPFIVDMAGNTLDLYDRVDHFDDVCHFANWALLCTAIGLLLPRVLPGWVIAGLCAGFGAGAAVVWEVGEYLTFVPGGPEAAGAYRDTIGDLALGTSGSLAAAAILAGALALDRRRR